MWRLARRTRLSTPWFSFTSRCWRSSCNGSGRCARRPTHLPVVLAPEEVQRVLAKIEGVFLLMLQLLYGCGLRVMECCRLRAKDIGFERGQILVRAGKGNRAG